jgi:hypothetical protein
LIRSSALEQLGWVHSPAVVDRAAVNMGVRLHYILVYIPLEIWPGVVSLDMVGLFLVL